MCVPLKGEPVPQQLLTAQGGDSLNAMGSVTSAPGEGGQQKHHPGALTRSFSDDMRGGRQGRVPWENEKGFGTSEGSEQGSSLPVAAAALRGCAAAPGPSLPRPGMSPPAPLPPVLTHVPLRGSPRFSGLPGKQHSPCQLPGQDAAAAPPAVAQPGTAPGGWKSFDY